MLKEKKKKTVRLPKIFLNKSTFLHLNSESCLFQHHPGEADIYLEPCDTIGLHADRLGLTLDLIHTSDRQQTELISAFLWANRGY